MAKEGEMGITQWELARAYIPFQTYTTRLDPQEGLQKGTIFPELYQPYRPKAG